MTTFALIAPVRVIVDILKPVLVYFHDSIGLGWGMSIVMLTVCVRALLFPLTYKQFKSMQAMARVTPQLKALQQKYKDDKQRQQQEIMKFYQEHKINPFASCLPLVAQLPFFLGLFYMLRTDLRKEICAQTAKPCGQVMASHGAEKFLFVKDLTDSATGGVLVVLIILYISSQLLSTILNTVTVDRNQKILMYSLPFMFTIFIINFPAGLIVYWITTNLWTVAQQYVVRRRLGPMRPPEVVAATAAASGGGESGGGLFARLARAAEGASGGGAAPAKGPSGPPPPPPRKKKKRSGRRR